MTPTSPGGKRDWVDYATLFLEVAGFLAVIGTIIITLLTNKSNDEDTAAAIGAMRNISVAMDRDRPILAAQKNAAETAARAAVAAAGSAKTQAETSAMQAKAATVTADATLRQINQGANLFAVQQRPVLVWDNNDFTKNSPQTFFGITRWNYAYKNVGISPAYNIRLFTTFFVNDVLLASQNVVGPVELPRGDFKWSTISYTWTESNYKRLSDGNPKLLVRLRYQDTLKNTYWSIICRSISYNGSTSDCSADYDPKTGKPLMLGEGDSDQ